MMSMEKARKRGEIPSSNFVDSRLKHVILGWNFKGNIFGRNISYHPVLPGHGAQPLQILPLTWSGDPIGGIVGDSYRKGNGRLKETMKMREFWRAWIYRRPSGDNWNEKKGEAAFDLAFLPGQKKR